MRTIKDLIESKKEKYRKNCEDTIRDSFDITERGGFMWLTHNGVAFMKLEPTTNIGNATAVLNRARECAVEFKAV